MERNPEIRQMLNNPEVLRQVGEIEQPYLCAERDLM